MFFVGYYLIIFKKFTYSNSINLEVQVKNRFISIDKQDKILVKVLLVNFTINKILLSLWGIID